LSNSHLGPDSVDRTFDAARIVRGLTRVEKRPLGRRTEPPDDPLASFDSESDGTSLSARHATLVARPAAGLSLAIRVEWLARQASRHPRIPSALRIGFWVVVGAVLGAGYVRYVAPVDSSVTAPAIAAATAPQNRGASPQAPVALPHATGAAPLAVSPPHTAGAPKPRSGIDRAPGAPDLRVPSESRVTRGPSGRRGNGSAGLTGIAATEVALLTPATIASLPSVGDVPVGLPTDAVRSASDAPAEAIERSNIRAVLDAYRHAYEQLDAVAASSLWPGVDTKALTRAFGTLRGHSVSFDSCDINLTQGRAMARCSGGITYVRRVGEPQPQSRSISWTFTLDRSSGQWRIAGISAR
jgi:hypothetical protein